MTVQFKTDERNLNGLLLKIEPSAEIEKKLTSGLNKGGKVIVEQDDPNSPLHSVKKFEELNL
jgi:hypothetical protein